MKPSPVSVLNVSAYLFVALDDAPLLRDRLLASASAAALKGTVLLAEEGINLVLAGDPHKLRAWVNTLRQDTRFAALQCKESFSSTVPFQQLRVKIKPEIIRMNQSTVRPQRGRAPTVGSATLARWLRAGRCDADRPLALLDTRNAFEVEAGRFEGAIDWRLGKFSDFPAALAAHQHELAGKTVVSYCTGGIRCEKAALWMAHAGVEHVVQLDGGILRYLEDTVAEQAPGWHGNCVVFDERGALTPALEASSAAAVEGPLP